MLYQWEVGGVPIDDVVDSYWTIVGHEPTAGVRRFAAELARGAAGDVAAIDAVIAASGAHWRVSRMAVVDRLILRMAVHEFRSDPATPRAVVINEALELARTFSGDQSVGFVNGVLDAISRRLEGGPERDRTEEGPDASGT